LTKKTGKTYFVLLPSASSKPSSWDKKSKSNGNVVLGLQSGILTVTDETLVQKITDLTLDTNYTLFSISEDSYSDIQAINIQLDVKRPMFLVPSLGTTKKYWFWF
jgi:hypothetical protein